jgi:hypothetical protein
VTTEASERALGCFPRFRAEAGQDGSCDGKIPENPPHPTASNREFEKAMSRLRRFLRDCW